MAMTQKQTQQFNNMREVLRRIAHEYRTPKQLKRRPLAQYGLPYAVSGSLTYYLWGPGCSWDVMILVARKTNNTGVFFDECELKAVVEHDFDKPLDHPHVFVCRKPRVPADVIWSSIKSYR